MQEFLEKGECHFLKKQSPSFALYEADFAHVFYLSSATLVDYLTSIDSGTYSFTLPSLHKPFHLPQISLAPVLGAVSLQLPSSTKSQSVNCDRLVTISFSPIILPFMFCSTEATSFIKCRRKHFILHINFSVSLQPFILNLTSSR